MKFAHQLKQGAVEGEPAPAFRCSSIGENAAGPDNASRLRSHTRVHTQQNGNEPTSTIVC